MTNIERELLSASQFCFLVFVTLAESYPLLYTLKRLIPVLCSLLVFVKIKRDNGWKVLGEL